MRPLTPVLPPASSLHITTMLTPLSLTLAHTTRLQGDESDHSSLRQRIVAFMCDHAEDFSPFVEDDQGFDKYAARMRREGVWAGHMELQAASLLLAANICIHQVGRQGGVLRGAVQLLHAPGV